MGMSLGLGLGPKPQRADEHIGFPGLRGPGLNVDGANPCDLQHSVPQ